MRIGEGTCEADEPARTQGRHYLEAEFLDLLREPDTVRFIDEGALDGLWFWDLEDPEQEWMSPGFWRTLGFDPDTKRHLASEWQDLIFPEDRDLALENFNKHLADPDHPYDQLVRYRTQNGGTVTVRCRGMAIRENGVPKRMLGAHTIVHDTRQKNIDREMSQMLEFSDDAVIAWSSARGVVRWNRGAEKLYDVPRKRALGRDVNALTEPQWPGGWAEVERTLAAEGRWQGEIERVNADGDTLYVSTRLQRVEVDAETTGQANGAGHANGKGPATDMLVLQIDRDIGARRQAERRALALESEQRQMLDGVGVLIGVLEPDGRVRQVNRTALLAAGTTHEAVVGLPFDDTPWWRVEEEWLEKLRAQIAAAARGETPRAEMPWSAADGSRRWVDFQIVPLLDDSGRVSTLIPSGLDITERHHNDERRRIMAAELNHRVKNNLALVRSLAAQTLDRSDPRVEEFGARLKALATAHGILTRSEWEDADLADIMAESLAVCQAGPDRIEIDCPSIAVGPQPATSLALAFHELCTNAIKYGALSNTEGTVRVAGRVEGTDGGDQLVITWTESGGPPVSPPSARGFGTKMLQRILALDIGAHVDMAFRPDGLAVTIRAPIATLSPAKP